MGFFSSKRDPIDNTADGDHLQSRTYRKRDTGMRRTEDNARHPRKLTNFSVESPGRKGKAHPSGNIER